MIDTTSPYYPHIHVQENYYLLREAEKLPKIICDYLIDAPSGGYQPPDDNEYPRCRFWKYLMHDGAEPLSQPLPSLSEKMDVLFNPNRPENPPTEKGYRLIPQIYVKKAQTEAQTRVMVYIGRTVPSNDEFKLSLGVTFNIRTHYTCEANAKTDAYSRSFAIEQALIEAFHGVSMEGIGTFCFSQAKHPDCGSRALYDDDANVGRELTIALEVAAAAPTGQTNPYNMPFFTPDGKIRLA